MQADIKRWDEKYRAPRFEASFSPEPLLVRHRGLLGRAGRALDVACGTGRNALYLARLGFDVTAVDGSVAGLDIAAEQARKTGVQVDFVAADLDDYALPPAHFALIVVVSYLDRNLFASLRSALRPGGVLVYQTFNRNFLLAHPGFCADYVLEPLELTNAFSDLDVLATNEAVGMSDAYSLLIAQARD